jgi:hypothetical protein
MCIPFSSNSANRLLLRLCHRQLSAALFGKEGLPMSCFSTEFPHTFRIRSILLQPFYRCCPFAQFQWGSLVDSNTFHGKRKRHPIFQIVVSAHRPFFRVISVNNNFHRYPFFTGSVFSSHARSPFAILITSAISFLPSLPFFLPYFLSFVQSYSASR